MKLNGVKINNYPIDTNGVVSSEEKLGVKQVTIIPNNIIRYFHEAGSNF